MDPSQSKTSNFAVDASPPLFSFELQSDTSGSPSTSGFEGFAAYGSSGFPAASTPNTSSLVFNQWHSSPTGASASTGMSHEIPNLTISPPLTLSAGYGNLGPGGMYQPALSSSDMDSTESNGLTSPTARGQSQLHDSGRSSTNSPPSSTSTSHRYGREERYDPRGSHESARGTTRSARSAARRSATATRRNLRGQEPDFSDDEGEGIGKDMGREGGTTNTIVSPRHSEETRLQRIESEQRRRDELRNGYARLKSALPISNQKSSKVSLLDRAITYIRHLETSQTNLQTRLENSEKELNRQRSINEGLIRAITDPTRLSPATSDSASRLSSIILGESSSCSPNKNKGL